MTYIRQALAQPSLREVVAGLIHGTAEFLFDPWQSSGLPFNPRGAGMWHGRETCKAGDDRLEKKR